MASGGAGSGGYQRPHLLPRWGVGGIVNQREVGRRLDLQRRRGGKLSRRVKETRSPPTRLLPWDNKAVKLFNGGEFSRIQEWSFGWERVFAPLQPPCDCYILKPVEVCPAETQGIDFGGVEG